MRNKGIVLGLLGVGLFIVLWELYAIAIDYPLFPRVYEILFQIVRSFVDEGFAPNFLSTFSIAVRGILIATSIGVFVGIIMGESNSFRKLLSPLINSFRGVSGVSLFPILIVIFGIRDGSRVFVIFWTAVFPIILNTISGIINVDKEIVEAGQTSGAGRLYILLYLKIPLSLNTILNGVKIGMGTGWISLVVAEMLGASRGLGFMLTWSAASFQFAKSYSYIFIISAVLGILTYGIEFLQKRIENKIYN